MQDTDKSVALSELKEMQAEITAIRYYNRKLNEIKKNIEASDVDPSSYTTNKADALKIEQANALNSLKSPQPQEHPIDLLLFIPFAVFSIILMIILYPSGKSDLLGGVVNWIFNIYFVLYPVFIVLRQLVPAASTAADRIPKFGLIALLSIYGVSVVFVLISVFFRPVFLLCIVPLILGVLALLLKDKENDRLDRERHAAELRKVRADYDRMIRDAKASDRDEALRFENDVEKQRQEKEAKYASVIKECNIALSKHKARFKEVKVIPDDLMQKDMGVVDSLIAIIERGDAQSIDSAIEIYKSERAKNYDQSGEIYVYVGIKRRDGWSAVRNLVYLDGEKCCSAQMPYSVIKAAPGIHDLSTKVQLNYGGSAHYPESDKLQLNVKAGEKIYVKFYVKGSPEVKYSICEDINSLTSEI